jgi:hypothetical protein
MSPMDEYLHDFDTKNFSPPSPGQIKKWKIDYELTTEDFSIIIGVTPRQFRRFLYENGKEHRDMTYSQVKLFLICAGLITPKVTINKKYNYIQKLRIKVKDDDTSLENVCFQFLGIKKTYFYKLLKEKPQKLNDLIKDKIVF